MKKQFLKLSLLFLAMAPLASFAADTEAESVVKKEEVVEEKIEQSSPEEAARLIIKTNDRDGDNMLSKEEVDLPFRLNRFDKVDTNGDKKLSQDELTNSYANAKAAEAQTQTQTTKKAQKKESLFKRINIFD